MTTTNIIEIIGIASSLFVGFVSIIISICTLKQNSKMIKEGNRAYITLFVERVHNHFTYIKIKNFGQSAGIVNYVKITPSLHNFGKQDFSNLDLVDVYKNIYLAPGQSIATPYEFIKERDKIIFDVEISYNTLGSTIIDKYTINLSYIPYEGWVTPGIQNELSALKHINESIQSLVQK